jgi:hypothetical protein
VHPRHHAEVRRPPPRPAAAGVPSRELAPAPAGPTESGLVEALLRLGHGAAYGGPTAAAHRRHLHDLVRLAIAGAAAR